MNKNYYIVFSTTNLNKTLAEADALNFTVKNRHPEKRVVYTTGEGFHTLKIYANKGKEDFHLLDALSRKYS